MEGQDHRMAARHSILRRLPDSTDLPMELLNWRRYLQRAARATKIRLWHDASPIAP